MDVLKEIAQAEGRAREIDLEFRKKAEDLVESARGRLAQSRIESEKTIEKELAALRAELDRSLEVEKNKVTETGRKAQETIERQVRDNSSRAAQILMKGIGL